MLVFGPGLCLVDTVLQRLWPIDDPQPDEDMPVVQRSLFEVRVIVKSVLVVLLWLIPLFLLLWIAAGVWS